MHKAIQNNDRHDDKIAAQRASLAALAVNWQIAGEITEDQRDEIVAMTEIAGIPDFRPMVYVVPQNIVAARMKAVPAKARASLDPEYIVEDLDRSEFDIIELASQ